MKTKFQLLKSLLKQEYSKEQIRNANLSDANLRNADLNNADLSDADLSDANLSYANLSDANLRNADLRNADLNNANLSYADLSNADLSNADLSNANLSDANLRNANLSDANLRNADLNNANLSDIKINETTFGIVLNCPEEGEFIAFKKCQQDIIVKLLILSDSKRSSATSYKCRASKVKVLEIKKELTEIASNYDSNFIYKLNEIIEVSNFDENRWKECSTGVHFFMSKELAKQYD